MYDTNFFDVNIGSEDVNSDEREEDRDHETEDLRKRLSARRLKSLSVQISNLNGSDPMPFRTPRPPPSRNMFRKSQSLDKNIHHTLNSARLRKHGPQADDLWLQLEQESGISEEMRRQHQEERKRMLAEGKRRTREKKEEERRRKKVEKTAKKLGMKAVIQPEKPAGEVDQVAIELARQQRDRANEERRLMLEQMAAGIKERKEEEAFLKQNDDERARKRAEDLARVRERMRQEGTGSKPSSLPSTPPVTVAD